MVATLSLLTLAAVVAAVVVAAPTAVAADPVTTPGAHVAADPQSPTGYTVTFVYHNANATQVRLAGDLTLLDSHREHAVPAGGVADGPVPRGRDRVPAGHDQGHRRQLVGLPAAARRRPQLLVPGLGPDPGLGEQAHLRPGVHQPAAHRRPSFRVRNNDVLDAVYVPYAEKQNDPVLEARA